MKNTYPEEYGSGFFTVTTSNYSFPNPNNEDGQLRGIGQTKSKTVRMKLRPGKLEIMESPTISTLFSGPPNFPGFPQISSFTEPFLQNFEAGEDENKNLDPLIPPNLGPKIPNGENNGCTRIFNLVFPALCGFLFLA